MKFHAVVFDLDGTLLTKDKKVTQRSLKMLNNLVRRNVHIIFATARPPRTLKALEIDGFGSVIGFNGASIRVSGSDQVRKISIPGTTIKNIVAEIWSFDSEAAICFEIADQWYTVSEFDYRNFFNSKNEPIQAALEFVCQNDCEKIMVNKYRNVITISDHLHETNTLETDGKTLIQIMHKNATKENAIKTVAESLNIKLENIICFGDDTNDIGMFKTCGYKVAMANAVEALKELADEITLTNDDDGCAQVIERFLKD